MTERLRSLIDHKDFSFIAFKARHLNEEIEGIELYEEIYGKDKVRTIHVLLVLCLHLAVDPPDFLAKISPCAKLEAWYDPREKNLTRALETIGKNLQSQYERWQPKARYKQSLDPTIEEVHRFCHSLRRSARDERVLFHYNGHGVPRPTENGEIWVFNKVHTKYIPLSLYDLQTWMGGPSVYVFDCNNAERIIKMMEVFANKRQEGTNPSLTSTPQQNNGISNNSSINNSCSMENNIILAACQDNQDTPQNPEIPADLFTACLTTPIKTALHWYLLRHKEIFPGYLNESMLDLIGGSPSNRISMFGEINWVFTAVTDTIAWSCLSPALFQKLFRQDLLVASLFRNFLLAERIMHYYDVRPVSYPVLPSTYRHPMWDAWDHALDGYVSQLPDILRKKQEAMEASIEDNLPIIPHPPTESYDIQLCSSICSNDTSEEEEDDLDDDEEFQKEKYMGNVEDKRLIPRNMLNNNINDFVNAGDRIICTKNNLPTMITKSGLMQQIVDLGTARADWNEALNLKQSVMRQNPASNKPLNFAQHHQPQPAAQPQQHQQPTQVVSRKTSMKQLPSNVRNTRRVSVVTNKQQIDPKNPLNGPSNDSLPFKHSEFFNDHMTAFELWLKTADSKKPVPMQLPILLQVLLSQVHRFRALRLISEYMDLGPWAVINCLTVGIFPYVVRLLQSPVSDVKPYLVFIWGKIISSAQTDFAKNDVVKEAGYKYFVSCLTGNEQFEIIIKTIATFTLAKMLINNPTAQKLYMNQNFMTVLIEELDNNPPDLANNNYIRLRIWFILCFAKLWSDNDEAKWYGVRQQIHDKLLIYLKDVSPEVRAATVFALGTFLNNRSLDGVRSQHAIQVDQGVCQHMLNNQSVVSDSSPLVRTELVVTMRYMVQLFADQIISIADYHDELIKRQVGYQDSLLSSASSGLLGGPSTPPGPFYSKVGGFVAPPSPLLSTVGTGNNLNTSTNQSTTSNIVNNPAFNRNMKKVRHGSFDLSKYSNRLNKVIERPSRQKTLSSSESSDSNDIVYQQNRSASNASRVVPASNFSALTTGLPITNIYMQMYQSLLILANDPYPKISAMATQIVETIKKCRKSYQKEQFSTESQQIITNQTNNSETGKSPINRMNFQVVRHSALYPTHKHKTDNINTLVSSEILPKSNATLEEMLNVTSDFFNWSCKYFTQPLLPTHRLISNSCHVNQLMDSMSNPTPIGSPLPITPLTATRQQQLKYDSISCNTYNSMLFGSISSSIIGNTYNHSNRRLPNLKKIDDCNAIAKFGTFVSSKSNHFVNQSQLKRSHNTSSSGSNSSSSGYLMHISDTAKYEDRAAIIEKHKQLRSDGFNSWNECMSSPSHLLTQVFLQKIDSKPELLKFHPYRNYLAVADKFGVSLWNLDEGTRAQYIGSHISMYKTESMLSGDLSTDTSWNRTTTSIEFINCQEEQGGLLLVGTMDGKLKIWRHYLRDMGQEPEIVTAWNGINDQICSQRPSGIITHWSQSSGELAISGDVKYVRLWDSVQESRIVDFNTGLDSCVTCLDRSKDGRLLFAGFGDGHVKLFDCRTSSNNDSSVTTMPSTGVGSGDSIGWQHCLGYSERCTQLSSVAVHGDIMTWDLRNANLATTGMSKSGKNHTATKIMKRQPPSNVLTFSLNKIKQLQPQKSHPAHSREGLLKSANERNINDFTRLSLAKKYAHSTRIHTVTCADLRVTSDLEKNHVAVMGYGREPRGILTALTSTGVVSSNFRYYEGFSRANIETPSAVTIHPYQNLVGLGLEDCNLLLLKLQPK